MTTSIYKDLDTYISTIHWAMEYTIEYQKNGGDFDPFKILTGTDSRQSKLNTESLNFLAQVENLVDEFRKTRKKYL